MKASPTTIDFEAAIPRKEKGFDYRDAAADLDNGYLLELAMQLRSRACMWNVSKEVFDRAKELEAECLRRMSGFNRASA